jgi:sulfite exporter TauE/SafE
MDLYLAGFLFGLFGSMHCVGMCGPIALALPAQDNSFDFWLSRINYNLGRSITYAFMGGALGLIGFGAHLAGYQEVISIVGGATIVIVALAALIGGKTNWMHLKPVWLPVESLKKGMGKLLKINSPSGVLGLGLLNGFLPCGFVYVALAGALASGSAIDGMIYMFLFGMGTFPIMFAVSSSNRLISMEMRMKMQKAVPYVAIALGVILILRGLSLGIPFLSPELENMATGASMMGGEGESCH